MTGFIEALPPRIEILGLTLEIQPLAIFSSMVVLPFIFALLARRRLVLASAAYFAVVITLALFYATLLLADNIYASPVPFPWDFVGQYLLWSAPAIFAGYVSAIALEKYKGRQR